MKYVLAICCICLLTTAGMAQSKKRDANPSSRGTTVESGSENVIFSETKRSPTKSKYTGKTAGDLKREYYARMEANSKKYERMAKDMEKPQYSDPSYFGHKKKPKKNRIAKKKFCKECGIRH